MKTTITIYTQDGSKASFKRVVKLSELEIKYSDQTFSNIAEISLMDREDFTTLKLTQDRGVYSFVSLKFPQDTRQGKLVQEAVRMLEIDGEKLLPNQLEQIAKAVTDSKDKDKDKKDFEIKQPNNFAMDWA